MTQALLARPLLRQIAKFVIVGVLNTLVDFGVLNLLIFFTGVASGVSFSVFKGIAFLAAVTNSFLWNKYWTFRATGRVEQREAAQFFAVSVVGFFLNVGAASTVVNVIGPQLGLGSTLWANVGAAVGAVISMAWNFIGYKFFVFRK